LDLAKYRTLFLEEATDHLAEMSRALLELEKDAGNVEAIDLVFRMAHSIKGMAGSLGYDAVTEVSHVLEDRMDECRTAGRVDGPGLGVLFRGLEGLERMVETVKTTGEGPPSATELLAELAAEPAVPEAPPPSPPAAAHETPPKKV
jgi:two-component system chemotaxis sensor kinase CheA